MSSAYIPSTPSQSINYTIHNTKQPINDTLSVIDDIINVLQSSTTEDIELIKKIQSVTDQIQSITNNHKLEYKQLIQQCTDQLNAMNDNLSAIQQNGHTINNRSNELKQQKSHVESNINTIQQNINELQNRYNELKQQVSINESSLIHLQQQSAIDIPLNMNTISLYQKLSNITWDYTNTNINHNMDGSNNSNGNNTCRVKGTFHFTAPVGLHTFDIHINNIRDESDQYNLATQLWNVMYTHHHKRLNAIY